MLLSAAVLVLLSACHKKDDPVPPTNNNNNNNNNNGNDSTNNGPGTVHLSFVNKVGNQQMVLSTTSYVNAHGDSFTINHYKYYISNIKLTTDSGKVFTEPNSYHLISEESDSTKSLMIANVPKGNYTSVSFMIGVDSMANATGAQAGYLDPIYGMYWGWSTGYIMAKLEGRSPQSQVANHVLSFHIAGYKGPNRVQRIVTLPLSDLAKVTSAKTPVITFISDAAKWFGPQTIIDFGFSPMVMEEGAAASAIADNYANMFSIESVHNP